MGGPLSDSTRVKRSQEVELEPECQALEVKLGRCQLFWRVLECTPDRSIEEGGRGEFVVDAASIPDASSGKHSSKTSLPTKPRALGQNHA